MVITLTENAAKQIQRQLAKRGKWIALRIGVKKVGCSGLAHTLDRVFHASDFNAAVALWAPPREGTPR